MRKVLIFFALFLVAIDVSICVGNSVMFSSLDRRLEGCKIEDAGDWLREDEKHHSYHVEYAGEWIVVKSSYDNKRCRAMDHESMMKMLRATFSARTFVGKLNKSRVNWLEINPSEAMNSIVSFLETVS